MPVQAPTQGHPFYGYLKNSRNFSRLLRRARVYGGPILVLKPWVPAGIDMVINSKVGHCNNGLIMNNEF